MTDKFTCLSTHGGMGYAPGSYRDGTAIICGACGFRIKNPRPTGMRSILYSFTDVRKDWTKLFAWIAGREKKRVPTYPNWIA